MPHAPHPHLPPTLLTPSARAWQVVVANLVVFAWFVWLFLGGIGVCSGWRGLWVVRGVETAPLAASDALLLHVLLCGAMHLMYS